MIRLSSRCSLASAAQTDSRCISDWVHSAASMLVAHLAPNLHRRIGLAFCLPLTAGGTTGSVREPRVTHS
jgi:hypothetical protein